MRLSILLHIVKILKMHFIIFPAHHSWSSSGWMSHGMAVESKEWKHISLPCFIQIVQRLQPQAWPNFIPNIRTTNNQEIRNQSQQTKLLFPAPDVLCTRAFAFPCFIMGSSSSICPSGSWETYNIHWVLYVYSCHHDNLYSNVVTITIMGKKILKTDVTIHTCGVMVYETVLEGWLCTALIRCGFWLI